MRGGGRRGGGGEVEEKEDEEENVDKVEDDNIIYNIGNTCSCTHVCTCRYP